MQLGGNLALSLPLLVVLQLTPAQRVGWVPNPRIANGGWVSDPSHHLTPATITAANNLIGTLERETGAEIGVAVVDSTSGLEMQEFATALHRAWGVGKKGANNGVLLLWDPVHRAVFISVGYGLEGAIPDRRAGRIRDDIIASFRRSDFDGGILTGVREIAAAAREEPAPTSAGAAERRAAPSRNRPQPPVIGGGHGWWQIPLAAGGGLLALAIAGLMAFRRWQRRRPRLCDQGHPMRLLGESADDALLDKGQKLEEQLGSVDYDVWVCDTCGDVLRVQVPRFFSGYDRCPQCGYKTCKRSTRRLFASTTTTHGRQEVTLACGNCGFKKVTQEELPLQGISSDSGGPFGGSGGGGGGGGFGGGSAGGGGAGGHY